MTSSPASETQGKPETLLAAALCVLQTADAREKARLTHLFAVAWKQGDMESGFTLAETPDKISAQLPLRPARPARPELLSPLEMPKRKVGDAKGLIALLHARAHIELNAIDLAWDIILRFGETVQNISNPEVGRTFCDDWVTVADDEARHFVMLAERLSELDSHYGALPAHDGLWEAAISTRHDLLARLALVPMVLEARGLDVTPATIARLERLGQHEEAAILDKIYKDEIAHVAFGVKWFEFMADKDGLDAREAWRDLVRQHFRGQIKGPFNVEGRQNAGFSAEYYELPTD